MAEFGAGGAGRREEDRRALKEGKKLLKKALGAAGVLKGGKHKEKLRREKQRRRAEEQARAAAEARELATRRAELHQRATARALAQKGAETERRCQATERALDGAQRKEQDLREQVRATEWEKEQAERERARWYEEAGQARSTVEAQRSRAQFYVTEAQRRDAAAAIASRQDDAHIDAARAEAAARTAAADASRRQAEPERARAFTASVEMHQTRDRLIDSKNHELRQQAERTNAYREEATRSRRQKSALRARTLRNEARLQDTEAEVSRLKEELEQARSTAAPGGELAADLDKLDRAVSLLVANKKDSRLVAIRKLIQELRARAHPSSPAPAPARGPAFTFGAAPPPAPAAPAAPVGDEGELAADLGRLDRAVSSLLASKNELKREVRNSVRRLPINNNGHSIVYAMDAVERDFEAMRKLIQEFRARAHTTTTEETQRLQLQVAAWRNTYAAHREVTQISSDQRSYPPQIWATDAGDAARKRQADALHNHAAARAAAEASTQEGDGDPDLYARLQNQHEEYNRRRNRTPRRGGRR